MLYYNEKIGRGLNLNLVQPFYNTPLKKISKSITWPNDTLDTKSVLENKSIMATNY